MVWSAKGANVSEKHETKARSGEGEDAKERRERVWSAKGAKGEEVKGERSG
jgi:hypothetical protein